MNNNLKEISDEFQLITFKLAQEIFAVDILQLEEICNPLPTTPVPNTADFVQGVINLKGKIIPVINLRKRFNLKNKEDNEKNKIIVTKLGNQLAGFTVDLVLDVLELPSSALETPSRTLAGFKGKYIKGMVKLDDNLIVLLNLEFILTSNELIDLSKIIIETTD